MPEFKNPEITVKHPPPAECTFGKFVASGIVGRPRENPVTRIAVVIHLAGLIALVLEFEPEGDGHGGRMSPGLGLLVSLTGTHGKEEEGESEKCVGRCPPS